MGKYNCEKCGKEFNQKSHYTTHTNKKNPCVVESKIKQMIDNAVKEKLIEIKKTSPSDIINNIEIVYDNKLVKDVPTKKIHIPKPILKWVGGKTQIIDKLITDFPVEINNYREAFLGGGSVLLTLLSYVKNGIIKVHGNIYAYDLNEPLIYIYKNIQTHHNELYDKLQTIITEFNECGDGEINRKPASIEEAKIAKENYYYWIRSEYNKLCLTDKKGILCSAMFIFLNKTCFRGVFRVGPRGFNVPYGHYKNPEIINKEHLEEIYNLIQNVVFECCDFNTSLTIVEPNDFVYLDPPYAPETNTSFVGYTENGFNIENHNNLFKLIHKLTETNKKLILSNADVSLVRENFTNEKYNINSILCKRSINSKNPDAKAKEVIIKNY
jgi:DNA adenine methylase|tara:strand:+ start:140 stop:1285 length:1146 start_codon:yes stop_codon:yes gene_type:complete